MRVFLSGLVAAAATTAGLFVSADQRSASTKAMARSARVTAAPALAGQHTPFRVSITTRRATGVRGRTRRTYAADVHAVTGASGCVNNRDRVFAIRPAGARVAAVLDPARGEGGDRGWCRGRFRGTVTYSEAFACPPAGRCRPPHGFPTRTEVVARFTVRVR